MKNALRQLVALQKKGDNVGIYAVCSANKYVLQAAMKQASYDNSVLLIEATSNQVDQFGGYTGMTPSRFVNFVHGIADSLGFDTEKIILGGDHLGPNVWQGEVAAKAMTNARELMRSYVEAGFQKIHLDASMRCADDSGPGDAPLAPEVSVARAAELCKACEDAADPETPPFYVIGTEVPIPGGANEELESIQPTSVSDATATIELTRKAFGEMGLQDAWQRVIAVVVQPGVEFAESTIVEYDRDKANGLSEFIKRCDNLVYEAHSTDYQQDHCLKKMVEDGFAILKVGPWLTFAFREAVFALANIEAEIVGGAKNKDVSNVIDIIDKIMVANPKHWQRHYHGEDNAVRIARRYSYSDRVRYYWVHPEIEEALNLLLRNLTEAEIPLPLLSQFLPDQYEAVRCGLIENTPLELIHHKIMEVTTVYSRATSVRELTQN